MEYRNGRTSDTPNGSVQSSPLLSERCRRGRHGPSFTRCNLCSRDAQCLRLGSAGFGTNQMGQGHRVARRQFSHAAGDALCRRSQEDLSIPTMISQRFAHIRPVTRRVETEKRIGEIRHLNTGRGRAANERRQARYARAPPLIEGKRAARDRARPPPGRACSQPFATSRR